MSLYIIRTALGSKKLDIQNSKKPADLSINSGQVGNSAKNLIKGQSSGGKIKFEKKSSLVARLDAIDKQYSYNSSLTELFNNMDANRIS